VASRATRDLGLRRIRVSTRYLAAGSLLVGGVLSAAVATALPGKASPPRSTGTVGTGGTSATSGTGGSQATEATPSTIVPPLTAPAQSPQPVNGGQPVVSSGGS
jgi:hypothetical protein